MTIMFEIFILLGVSNLFPSADWYCHLQYLLILLIYINLLILYLYYNKNYLHLHPIIRLWNDNL